MIYRVLYDGVDIHTNSVPDVLINPTVETEMNTAGSFTFTLPPDHFAWGDIYVFKGNVEVYENNDLIFFGRVANVDQNWNNERIVECEGALAFFNDSIQRPNSWTSNTLISQFLSDILDNHNAQVPDDRKIYLGNVTIDDMYVTRETNYEKTLDVLTRMCIDTNGGYFSLRKDENDGKIYLDWLKDLTDIAAQPVEFGLNLLDISRSLHAEDIVTGVLARGGEVNDVKIDLHEVGEIDDPSVPVIHHTNQDPDILWHRDGLEGYGRVVQVKEFNDCTTVDGDNGLLAKATEWLIKQNTDIDTIEVDAAELGYFGESYPIFLLGQKVLVNSHPHHLENVELPMYKISMNLDSGTKRISIGTPPKRELTQISASNMGGGSGSGSSSGGGSGSGGVQDVRVNGTSVVQDGIARVNVPTDTVTESEMNTAISTAVSGKANQSDLESLATTVASKANTSEVTAALALKADKTDIPEIEANPSDAATDTLNKIDIEGTVYQLAGGTQVEANPVEAATDDLETIKIGNTVYDISGGGSTNYGKFKCDVLFDTPTTTSAWASPIEICSEEKAKEYDMIYLITKFVDGSSNGFISNSYLVNSIGQTSDSDWIMGIRSNRVWNNTEGFIFLSFDNSKLKFYTNTGNSSTLYKVYGIKFENKLINRSDIYSEEERMIGRWTDGKPLYQKTIVKDLTLSSSWQNYYDLTGIDLVNVEINKLMRDSEPIPLAFSNIGVGSWIKRDGYLKFCVQGSQASEGWVLKSATIQYTKTTDTPDSGVIPEDPMFISDPMIYSEEEQVVGSWTDGKPLYQKVADVSIPSGNLNTWVNHNISGLTNATIVDYSYDILFPSEPSIGRNGYAVGGYEIQVCRLTSTNFYIIAGSGWNTGNIKIRFIIRYTKTIDSVLSGPKKGKIVQRSDIYSEEERLIGRWTDGKPIYQKTWTLSSTININTSGVTLPSQIGNDLSVAENIVNANAVRLKTDNASVACIPLCVWGSGTSYSALCSDSWSLVREITIQYTKTTDLPFSKQLIEDPQFVMMSDIYSEGEQVVGRWTDGKPLYQKTIKNIGVTLQQNTWTNTGIPFTDIDHWEVTYNKSISSPYDNQYPMLYRFYDGNFQAFCQYTMPLDELTLQYTKTTDAPGTGPTKGNLIYLPALYSEEEREVGVWTDGKPLYQKTIDVGSLSAGQDIQVNAPSNVDKMVGMFGNAHSSNYNQWVNINFPHQNITSYIVTAAYLASTNKINIHTGTDFALDEIYITIQYTKTTDAPGSGTWTPDGQLSHHYSTSEKVVGTWIDGSTVYERTWDFSANPISLPYDTWINTTIQSSDGVYRIISAECLTSGFLVMDENEIVVGAGGYPVGICAKINHGRSLGYLTLRYIKSSS